MSTYSCEDNYVSGIDDIRAVSNDEMSWIVLLSKIGMSIKICARFNYK